VCSSDLAGTPAGKVRLKPRSAWSQVGRAVRGLDLVAKTDGRAVYGMDVRPGGLVFAAVRMCPMLGGDPGRIDNEDEVLRRPGVERLVRLPAAAGSAAGVAVVGRTTWHAQQAVQALQIEWRAPPAGPLVASAEILAALDATARRAFVEDGGIGFHRRGDPRAAEQAALAQGAVTAVEAVYRAPYLAHMAMEPTHCTAQVADGQVTVWVPTQVPGVARTLAARTAGVREDAVTVHTMLLGGGFGRRLDAEVVVRAVVRGPGDRRTARAAALVPRGGHHPRLLPARRGGGSAGGAGARWRTHRPARGERQRRGHSALRSEEHTSEIQSHHDLE